MTIELHTLSNGLRVVTDHMPGLKSANIGIWVQAGGRHERVDQTGIAHFLEHMAFKGTKTRTALQIAEAIEDVGGFINAYTSREVTAYYARVLENDVSLGLDVLADILLNPVFDEAEIEVERGVILQEIGQTLDTPDDLVFDWLQEVAYPDQPLGRSILGPEERVASFMRADLQGFVQSHYTPNQMIISAAGAVDHAAIVRQVERLFGHLAPRSGGGDYQPGRFEGGERRATKSLEQVHLALALEGPDYRDPAIYTAQVFASILGGGMSSRLFQEIRERRGLCYDIGAQAGAYADTGLMMIFAGTSEAQIGDLARLTVDEMRRMADDVTGAEVDRARTQMKAAMLMGHESPSNRTERLARQLAIWDRIPTIDEMVAQIDAVTPMMIRDFAGGLAHQKAAMALYGPVSGAPSLADLQAQLAA